MLFVFPSHSGISLVADVVESFFEEVKVNSVSLLFSDEEVALVESGTDSCDIHLLKVWFCLRGCGNDQSPHG